MIFTYHRLGGVVVKLMDSGETTGVVVAGYNYAVEKRMGGGRRTMLGIVLCVNERIIK